MKPFEFQGKRLEVWTVAGIVLSTSKSSRTDISSLGGGGWVGPHGGTVSAPVVTSSTTMTREIWLRADDGTETAVSLVDVDVPLREGQRVTFIAAMRPKAKDGFWVTLVNDSAKRHWRLSTNAQASHKGELGAYPLLRWFDWIAAFVLGRFVALPIVRSIGVYLGPAPSIALLVGPPMLYLVVRWRLRARNRRRIFSALDEWSEFNAQAAYSREKSATIPAGRTEKVA